MVPIIIKAAIFCIWHYVLEAECFLQVLVDVQWFSHVRHFVSPWTAAHQFPVLHYLPEFAQTYVHWVSDAIQQSHPLSPPSPLALNLSQHQVFFKESASSGQSIGASASASVLPMNIQSWFPLGLNGLISLLSKRLSAVFSSTTVWKHQFFGVQPFLWSNSHIPTWVLEKPQFWLYGRLCFLRFCFLEPNTV